MKKRYSICLDETTMGIIDKTASMNKLSRSAVVGMFLDLANYLPEERLKITSPIPALLGICKEANNANAH